MYWVKFVLSLNSLKAIRISDYTTLGNQMQDLTVEVKGKTTTCSGVIYKPNIVLTAANCVQNSENEYFVNVYNSIINSTKFFVEAIKLYDGSDSLPHNLAVIKINRTSISNDNKPLLEIDWRDYGLNLYLNFTMLSRDIQIYPKELRSIKLSSLENNICMAADPIFHNNNKFWLYAYKRMSHYNYFPFWNPKSELCAEIHEPQIITTLQVLSGSPLFLEALVVTPILVGINTWGMCNNKNCSPFIFSRMSFMKPWIEKVVEGW